MGTSKVVAFLAAVRTAVFNHLLGGLAAMPIKCAKLSYTFLEPLSQVETGDRSDGLDTIGRPDNLHI